MQKNYLLGLDVGTDSVGWAVCDEKYNILKYRGNAMWGIRLFESSSTAQERRAYRQARRRTQRSRERLALLEMLFDGEISKLDNAFYQRLHESNLYLEDKTRSVKYSVFADENYTDKDYHKQYPTIYHLRSELVHSKQPHDVRLVYLALHHLIKKRGHFLFDFDVDSLAAISDFSLAFDELSNYINENYLFDDDCEKLYISDGDKAEIADILKDRNIGKKEKNGKVAEILKVTKKTDKQLYSMLSTLSGSVVELADIFDDESLKENETKKVTFAGDFDGKINDYQAALGERFELLEKLKAVYDWALLADVLNGKEYLCDAKVEVYEKHREDLKALKKYIKTYLPEKYNAVFKVSGSDDNYVAYSAHIKESNGTGVLNHKVKTQEDFCKYLKKVLGSCQDEQYAKMFNEIENGTFMPKQVSKDNGVIPMQVNEKELIAILDNAKEYLPFLNSADADGITVYKKIVSLFEYRIPYFVGPLNSNTKRSWVIRSDEKIYPWNIKEVVDYDKSAQAFIENLTSKCTYLPEYDVIPKNSLLYSKFTVLNELNNLKIDGEKISVNLKQSIFNDCFMTHNKVTKKCLENYLKSKGIEYTTLSGFDINFKSSLKPYSDLKEYDLTVEEKEEIIKAVTVFGDSKKMLRKRLNKEFSSKLSDDEILKISRLKYSGWGNLSKEFLTEVTATYKKTGEVVNIINALWITEMNLMELLYSDEFCCDTEGKVRFVDKIGELNSFESGKSLKDIVDGLYISPMVKRPVYQSLLIAKEIEKIMKCPPAKIFIEVAKGSEKKERTESRKKKLEDLYKACKKEQDEWYKAHKDKHDELFDSLEATDENALRSDKLFLYYTQFGKCMYSNKDIDLGNLMSANSKYDIDHIFPRSKIKDDSLDNRVLVDKTANAKKDNEYPLSDEIRGNMKGLWNNLLAKGFISQKKYARLVRNSMLTDDQLSGFISRQLVETRQSTKAISGVLEQLYPKPKTEIVYVKAALASEMRQEYDMLKCREVNDYHHAKDAYLNIVVGNVYNVKFTHNKMNFIKELQSNNKNYTVNLTSVLKHNIDGAWVADGNKSLNIVKSTMAKNNIRYTRYAFKKQGGLFDQQIKKKGEGQVPIKQNSKRSDIEKYGGYNKAASTYFSVVKYTNARGKTTVQIVPIDAYLEKEYSQNPKAFIAEKVGAAAEIIIPCLKYGSCLSFDGFRMHVSSKDDGGKKVTYKPGIQLVLGYKSEKYIKGIEKALANGMMANTIKDYEISQENNVLLYDALIEKITQTIFSKRFEKLGSDLTAGREKFVSLGIKEQCDVVNEILKILHANVVLGDLSLIGGSANSGKVRSNSVISGIKGVGSVKLINQSITGLFENEVELLERV